MSVNVCFHKKKLFCRHTSSEEKPDMYTVTVQRSLVVAFLLSLKGSYIHSADDMCAPVGSTALLSCPYKCSKKYTWTLDWKPIQLKSDRNKYSVNKKNCSLTIQNLNKMDRGTYHYCEIDDDDDDDDLDDCEKHCTTTLYVTDLQVNADVDRVTEGQKVTLTCHTSCPANTQSFIWLKNKNTQGLDHFSTNQLCFDPVSREHTGRYSCALKHYKSFSSAETFLDVSYASRITTASSGRSLETRAVTLTYNTLSPLPDVMIDSTGIILLSSLLVLLTLMLIGAAVWRRTKDLRRRDENESQSRNPSLRYSVFENIPAAPTEHQRQKKEEFDHKNDVQYCFVHFSKNAHQPARVDDVQYAAVKVPGRSDAPY